MINPEISIIAALDEKKGIGKKGALPWHIPEDLQRFKNLTTGLPIIMGRQTFDSIGRPLPKRHNIVISTKKLEIPGVQVTNSISEAIYAALEKNSRLFIIGGGKIYDQTISQADKLYLTLVKGDYHADAFFPDYEKEFDIITYQEDKESNGYKYSFINLERSNKKNG